MDNIFKLRAGTLNRTWDIGCKCHLKAAAGLHIDRCSLGPGRLAATLRCHELERATIAEQLRKRTPLSGQQRYASLSHLCGPCSSSSAASTGGVLKKGWRRMFKFPIPQLASKGGLCGGLCGHFGAKGPISGFFRPSKFTSDAAFRPLVRITDLCRLPISQVTPKLLAHSLIHRPQFYEFNEFV